MKLTNRQANALYDLTYHIGAIQGSPRTMEALEKRGLAEKIGSGYAITEAGRALLRTPTWSYVR